MTAHAEGFEATANDYICDLSSGLKRLVRQISRRVGFDVVRYPSRRRTMEESFEHLRRVGVEPRTVIDAGVGSGTPELYRAFPQARFLLVEPLAEYEPDLKSILRSLDGDYALAAATSRGGTVQLQVAEDDLQASTIFVDSGPDMWSEREVPGVSLDDLVAERGFTGPFLIKADIQGAELEALKGAEVILRETDAVALEVSLFEFYAGTPQLADVVEFMGERGFVTYDIVGGHERPLDGALAQVDMFFVPEGGVCRQTNRYG